MGIDDNNRLPGEIQPGDWSWLAVAEPEPADPPPNGDLTHVREIDLGDPWPIHDEGWQPVEAVDDPHRLARVYLGSRHQHSEFGDDQFSIVKISTLRYHRDEWQHWDSSCYRPVTTSELNGRLRQSIKAEFDRVNEAQVKKWLERHKCDEKGKSCPAPTARKVTSRLIGDVSGALASLVALNGRIEAPAWLSHNPPFPAVEVLPCLNGLVHIPSYVAKKQAIDPPTPRFFGTYSLDYSFDPAALAPSEWLKFLDSIFPDDKESVQALQEWFGYCLTPDVSHQKILTLIGPKRSGKGTIARILGALIGGINVAAPTLASLATNFGCESLIGKPLAIIADARLGGRTDQAQIVERLLSISGEDCQTIDRKHRSAWTGKLPTRFVLISNELPRLSDTSGALASRLIILKLTQSFLGREDHSLFNRLAPELPGILLWAIAGWQQLSQRGYFRQPKSGNELVEAMENLTSPVGEYVQERCDLDPLYETETGELYDDWRKWCELAGRERPGDRTNFGRNLRAVAPAVSTRQTRVGATPIRLYVGIRRKP